MQQLRPLLALFVSSGLLHFHHGGAIGLALLRAPQLGFSEIESGLLLSFSYLGLMFGGRVAAAFLRRSSYIRTFTVAAALSTVCTLAMPFFETPAAWFALRFVYGVNYIASIIVVEAWLVRAAPPKGRTLTLGVYLIFNYTAIAGSQLMLAPAAADPSPYFSLAAIGAMLAIAPMGLTRFAEPVAVDAARGQFSLVAAYRACPLAFLGIFACGSLLAVGFLTIVYAQQSGYEGGQISALATTIMASSFLLQLPIGKWSDASRDRRSVIIVVFAASSFFAGALFVVGEFFAAAPFLFILALVVGYGAFVNTAYGLVTGYGHDFVDPEKTAAYSARLYQVYALGAIAGPIAAGAIMSAASPAWFFGYLAIVSGAFSLLAASHKFMPFMALARAKPVTILPQAIPGATLPETDPHVAESVYSATDIGPDQPESETDEATADFELQAEIAYSATDIGPDQPESETGEAAADGESKTETAYSATDIGPDQPESKADEAGEAANGADGLR